MHLVFHKQAEGAPSTGTVAVGPKSAETPPQMFSLSFISSLYHRVTPAIAQASPSHSRETNPSLHREGFCWRYAN